MLTAVVRSGEFRPIDVAMVMSFIVGVLAYVPVWFRTSTGKAQATLVQELTDFVMNGIDAAPRDAAASAEPVAQPSTRRERAAKPVVYA